MLNIKKNLLILLAAILSTTIIQSFTDEFTNDVYAASENLALKKEAFASSMYNDSGNYAPEKINDGSYGTLWSDGAVKFTGPVAGYYYIAVDLADDYIINQIKAYPRIDFDDSDKLHNWYIQLSNTRDFSDAVTVDHIESKCEFGGVFTFDVELEDSYRYVRIASPNAYFTCGELEVFGEKYDPKTMSGKNNYIDTQNISYNSAASVCAALGIIDEADKSTFEGDRMMTRAGAVKAIVSMMKYPIVVEQNCVFGDVPDDYYAKDYITTAYRNNIISMGEKFRPDDFVTQVEFCKMIIHALGYENNIQLYSDWKVGTANVADRLKLLKYVRSDFDDYLSRGFAAQIIFNALKVPLNNKVTYKNNNPTPIIEPSEYTALYDLYDMKIVEGIQTENSASSMTHPLEKHKDHVLINNEAFFDKDGYMQKMLGKNVGILVSADGGDIITGYDDTTKNEITKVYASSFISVSNGLYRYENENGTTKTIRFNDNDIYVIKNYCAMPDWTYDDLKVKDGYLEFIDNNDDGKIEVISILEPQIIIGGYVLPSNGSINIVGNDGKCLHVEEPAYSRFFKNDKPSTPGKITTNDVMCVYKSENDAILIIEAYNKKVSGIANDIDDEFVVIGEDKYRLSDYYSTIEDEDAKLKIGENNICLLDGRNCIISVAKENVKYDVDMYGFVCRLNNDLNRDDANITVFNSNGNFETYDFAKNINYNDCGYKLDKFKEYMDNGSIVVKNKFIKYRKNSLNEICKIEVLEKSNVSLENNIVYIKNGYGIYNKGWMVQPLMPNTLCFTIPKVGNESVYKGHEDEFLADQVSKHMSELSQITEKWEFYDMDDLGFPALAVRYKDAISKGEVSVNAVKSNGKIAELIVKRVEECVNEDDEIAYCINGLDMSGNAKKIYILSSITSAFKADDIQGEHSEWINDDKDIIVDRMSEEDLKNYTIPIKDLKTGDILRIEVQDGYGIAVERTFDAFSGKKGEYERLDDGTYYSAGKTYPAYPDAEYRLVYGLSKSIKDDTYIMSTCERKKSEGVLMQYVNYTVLEKLIICDGKGFEVYSGADLPVNMEVGQEAVLFTRTAKPVCLILYK